MSLGVRIWRTVDGRYVGDGHLDAAFLAAGIDDPVPADFDEALELLVDAYPHKASILKGSGASGGGAGGGGGCSGGKTQITRAQFGQLSPAEQRAKATDPKVEIVD